MLQTCLILDIWMETSQTIQNQIFRYYVSIAYLGEIINELQLPKMQVSMAWGYGFLW